MLTPTIVVADDADRTQITKAITALRAKRDRMPDAWVDRRLAIDTEVDDLVDRWLAAPQ